MFRNPIIGSSDTLVREAIQSEGYQAGVSGWRVERDGDAEFNDVVVRGELLVSDPDGNYVHVYDEMPGDGAVIDLMPATQSTGMDPARIRTGVHVSPITGNDVPFLDVHGPRFISQASDPPALFLEGSDDTDTDPTRLSLINVDQIRIAPTIETRHFGDIVLDAAGDRITRGAIVAPTLLNSWVDFGGGFQAAGYVELPDHTGMLVGVIKDGTAASGTVLFNLPAALRPAAHQVFIAAGNAGRKAQIVVESDGDVVLQSPDAGLTWVSLGGCRWPISGF